MVVLGRFVAILAIGAFCLCADDAHSKGVHPRVTPDDYAVKATGTSATYAASLVPTEQAKHLFAFDITGKYLVFEIACFPGENKTVQIDADDFVIKHGDKGELTHSVEGSAVALTIQLQNLPKRPGRNGEVYTEAHVGYESGRDPVTGQRVNGVYGGGGAGVERGGGPPPPNYPRPGGMPEDRELLQTQLQERGLPAGKFDHAVAGYLYFPRAAVKKDGSGSYALEHLGETNAAGVSETVELAIPTKSR